MQKFEFDSGVINGGLNNTDDDSLIQKNQMADCQNIILDEKGFPEKREGIFTDATWNFDLTEGGATVYAENFYSYEKRSGAKYKICYGGTDVKYSQNNVDWTSLGVVFSTTHKMRFITFCDKLIMFNGVDEPYYWDGSMTAASKIGAPVLTDAGSGSTVTDGIHRFKVTYEVDNIIYDYNVYGEITVAGNNDVNVTGIPLGSEDADTLTRRLWVTKAADYSEYYLATGAVLGDTATTATFNVADATLGTGGYTAYTTYLATKVKAVSNVLPQARFAEVYENRLFFAHDESAPSTYYWSEPNSFEDFPLENVESVDLDDGEYVTGIKKFDSAGQLLIWKKSRMYGIYESGGFYLNKPLSKVGCTFSESIQEFNIKDEYGERGSMLFANKDGIWEWTGSTNRIISDQPNGNSIQKLWKTVRQREMEYKKNIKTTSADFIDVDGASAVNNWFEKDENQIRFKNIFEWTATANQEAYSASCWDSVNKRIWVAIDSGLGTGKVAYYSWNTATNSWGTVNYTVGNIGGGEATYGNTVKMEYDTTTDKIYGITSGGYIWRTQNGSHASPYSQDVASSKTFTITGASGTSNIMTAKSDGIINYRGNIKVGSVYTDTGSDAVYNKTNFAFIPYRATVTNNATSGAIMYYKKSNFMTYSGGTFTDADGSIASGGTATLSPGLYTIASLSNVAQSYLEYTRVGNFDMKIWNLSGVVNLYYIDHDTETITLGVTTNIISKKVLKKINLLGGIDPWGTATGTTVISRSYAYFGDTLVGGTQFTLSGSDETSGWTSYIRKYFLSTFAATTSYTTSTTYEILRHREYLGGTTTNAYIEGQKVADGTYDIGTVSNASTSSNTIIWSATAITMYNNSSKNIPIMYSSTKAKFYYINNTDYKFYEATMSDIDGVSLDVPNSATGYNHCVIATNIADGVPDQILEKQNAVGFSYWRGIVGSYTLGGSWLAHGTNSIDTGANSMFLQTLTATTDNETVNSKFTFYIKITTTTAAPATLAEFIEVPLGEELEGTVFSLQGAFRYVHERITGTFNVNLDLNDSQSSSFTGGRPTIEGIVLSWIDIEGGTTIPKTEIATAVHGNRFYIAMVETRPNDATQLEELTNNIICVLDRYKRWVIWRGRGCWASAFIVQDGKLYWADCKAGGNSSAVTYTDHIFNLGTKTNDYIADKNTDGTDVAIDAYFTTKNYDAFSQYDNGSRKKKPRKMYVTSRKYVLYTGTYNLKVKYRGDEEKYTESDGTNFVDDDKWTTKTMSVANTQTSGKINSRIDFPNTQPKKRWQFMFQNDTIHQDLGILSFILKGWFLHGRD